MEVFREAALRVRGRLEELGEGRDVFGLIHRDINLRNVVFSWRGVGVLDFDLSGLGHYLLDLAFLRNAVGQLPEERRGALWAALLEGYEGVRPPPGSRARLEVHLDAFWAMQRVAAVNRQLGLLGSEAAGQGTRGPRFLRTSLMWLRQRARYLATMPPYALGELPRALTEFLAP